jgi:hypothetical protein
MGTPRRADMTGTAFQLMTDDSLEAAAVNEPARQV